MKISIITDEISADPETAIELSTSWGITDFELRGIGTERVPILSHYHKARIKELLQEYSARIIALSPGLFKFPFPEKERDRFPLQAIDASLFQKWHDSRSLFDYHCKELLPASIEYAKELGVSQIIVFSFDRGAATPPGFAPDPVLETLQSASQEAAKSGIQLSIEVEAGFWADTGSRSAAIIKSLNQPNLGINWDPGNACAAGDLPFPEGYQAVREFVHHVHFKDLLHGPDGSIRYSINGEIDWEGQIHALSKDGYSGFISVEPHMQPKVASVQAALGRLKSLLDRELSSET